MSQVMVGATDWRVTETADRAVSDLVQRVLNASESKWQHHERRRQTRHPFPQLLSLTPIENDAVRPIGEPITIVGKNLSLGGLDFYHCDVLPFRRAIVSLDEAAGAHLIVVVSWCRFLRRGWYDSGGHFTHIVSSGQDGAEDFGGN